MPPVTKQRASLQAAWRWPALFGLHLAAALLLASWLWPSGQAFWAQLDNATFALLNGSLAPQSLWSGVWAIASLRLFDLLAAGLMLTLLIRKDWLFNQTDRWQALFTFIALLAILLVIRVIFGKFSTAYGWQHSSPSLQILDSVRLSEQYPWLAEHLDLKDASKRSFPGDHASVLMLWGAFMALFARRGKLALVLGLTTLLMLPRLFAGAHWLSDDLVGGVILTLLAFAWGYCTPVAGLLANIMQRLAKPILKRLPRWI
jgi:membrane-associated phospholipid phosphatase